YRAGSLEMAVLHTPGHSPGGITLAIDNSLFTGDALFAGSIGRSDFSNSDGRALLEGIRSQLLTQPDDFLVYSGHGPVSTIGQEHRQAGVSRRATVERIEALVPPVSAQPGGGDR